MAKRPPTKGAFKKGDDRPKLARRLVRANAQSAMKDEMLQILISALNEMAPGTDRAKKYFLIDALIAMGCGIGYKVGTKVHYFTPDKGAIKEIFDRLMGRPVQAVQPQLENGSRVTLIFDADGDETD